MAAKTLATFNEPQLPPEPFVAYSTVGRELADQEDKLVFNTFRASNIQEHRRYADYLSANKLHPRNNRVRHLIARLGGRAMTPEEANIVDSAKLYGQVQAQHYAREGEVLQTGKDNLLWALRYRLQGVRGGKAQSIDDYLDKTAPPFLRSLRDSSSSSERASWVSWLSEASDGQLVNFCQWNVTHNAQQQKRPDIAEYIQAERTRYRRNVRSAIGAGWLSPLSLEHLDKLDHTTVALLDPIEATLRGIMGESHRYTSQVTVLVEGLTDEKLAERFADILPHEFNHAILQNITPSEPLDSAWIMEALTEYIDVIMSCQGELGVYAQEQLLYGDLMQSGSQVLPLNLGTLAYSGGETEKQAFYRALDRSWGVSDALRKVTDFKNDYLERLCAAKDDMLPDCQPDAHDLRDEALGFTRFVLKRKPELIFEE